MHLWEVRGSTGGCYRKSLVVTQSCVLALQKEDAGGDKVRERINMFVSAFTLKQADSSSKAK